MSWPWIGAHALQNRARTYAGAASCDGRNFYTHAGKGLARQVFSDSWLNRLHGKDALVHLRYPTDSDAKDRDNTQPIKGIYEGKEFYLAHNGNLTNKEELRNLLPEHMPLATAIDSELIVRLIEHTQTGNIEKDLPYVFRLLRGSFSLIILMNDSIIAVRDKSGNHPLSIAELNGGYCVASETSAFPPMQATYLEDVDSGTMVIIKNDGMRTIRFDEPIEKKCVFELLYFSNPVSRVFGVGVTRFRQNVGKELERLFPMMEGSDVIVTPVPDSGKPYAQGFAKSGKSGEELQVILRNHYVGRTFNAATQALRDEEISRKFMFDADEIEGRRIVVLDDSIVRGSTLPKIINMLWQLGAKEVHVRIATPPIVQVCRYGIYMEEDQTKLVAAECEPREIAKRFKATSLEFLPLESLKKLLPDPQNYCFACMGEAYW